MKTPVENMRYCLAIFSVFLFAGCVGEQSYEIPVLPCESGDQGSISIQNLIAGFPGETTRIREDLLLRAVVSSSDKAGNFFGTLHLQDREGETVAGLQLELDLRDAHLFYPAGSELMIRLKGLYLGKSAGAYKIGGGVHVFGNLSVGRLPAAAVADHIFPGCEPIRELIPGSVEIPQLNDSLLNTLVRIDEVRFEEAEAKLPFAPPEEEAIRILSDCRGNIVGLRTSGYADFHSDILPIGLGSITGVLQKENNRYVLVIRDLSDISFEQGSCPDLRTPSDLIFISEIGDPDNQPEARFLELFFSGDSTLNLLGWSVIRYTNEQIEPGAVLDLSGHHISPGETLVIAADAPAFESIFGFPPDLESSGNGPADSNGDDNLVLVDPFGEVADTFGRIGEDGTGTDHEFEDGRAVRKAAVSHGSPDFKPVEWQIYNDSGPPGTTRQPQYAPEDFTPGVHETEEPDTH